ncbi:acetyl-CoA carboxylase, carboxyltransferase subunit beta [Victivallis sp.]|uniref:acetyl-CoA carboxylase, carboxyltransferase subunit beta n=1 Tax=Victivallis sp. TaxID=2049020 RepID=UPI003A9538D9
MSLFSSGKYSTLRMPTSGERKMVIPDGSWVKCKNCGQTLYTDRLHDNLLVCWYCNCHLPMSAHARIVSLTDPDSFVEMDRGLKSIDSLGFTDSKPYSARLEENTKKTSLNDAIVCGSARLDGHPYMLGVMDFRFMGASMGSVVGEKIARMVERATAEKLPVVIVTASGGARMQEGILSLMQMPKTCAVLERHAEAGLPYFAILTNPTYGGVTASFAAVGDVIIAEPGAMIGFAGPRVIQETTNSKLPEGFQTAEFLLEKGLIDRVVERKNLRKELGLLLEFFKK